jgi:hypothetical protein
MLRNKNVLLSILSVLAVMMFAFNSSPFSSSSMLVTSDATHPARCRVEARTHTNLTQPCQPPEAETDNDADDVAVKFGPDFADLVALSKAPAGTTVQNTAVTSTEDELPVYTVTLVNGNYTWTVTINSQSGNFINGGYRSLPQ